MLAISLRDNHKLLYKNNRNAGIDFQEFLCRKKLTQGAKSKKFMRHDNSIKKNWTFMRST